jgi:hypothetical protein
MPSVSPKQARFMAMCASVKGRKKARGKCPPMETAHEFHEADKAKARKHRGALVRAVRGGAVDA